MVPIQCEENPEGQNGYVIFENILDHGHPNSTHNETLRVPVQCEENPEGQNGYVIFENRSYRLPLMAYIEDHGHQNPTHDNPETQQNDTVLKVPVQSEENPDGQNGCVIVDSRSYRLQGHQSSDHYETHQNDISLRVPVQCHEDQHVLHGLVEFDNLFYTISIQPHAEEDSEAEGIHENEDFCNDMQRL